MSMKEVSDSKRQQGSMAIEAVISFTVFICFMFTLLTIVKMSMVKITLDAVTSETAKTIATSAYPLSFLMEKQDAANEEANALLDKFELEERSEDGPDGILGYVMDVDYAVNAIGNWTDALVNLVNNLDTMAESTLWNLLGNLQSYIGGQMVSDMINTALDDSGIPIDRDNVTVTFVKFPQAKSGYEKIPEGHLTDFSISKDDYSAEDAVIALEYSYNISLGILPDIDVTLRSISIEHGWLYGGNGVRTASEEGIDVDKLASIIYGENSVYIGSAWTGNKYHKKNCRTLYHGASRISLSVAQQRGYTPCKVCNP